MENNPNLKLIVEGKEFSVRPENTTLYTYLGKTAIDGVEVDNSHYNHIRIEQDKDDEDKSKFIIFPGNELYETILNHVVENDYPMYINRREVHEEVLKGRKSAIDNMVDREISDVDTVPEDWN